MLTDGRTDGRTELNSNKRNQNSFDENGITPYRALTVHLRRVLQIQPYFSHTNEFITKSSIRRINCIIIQIETGGWKGNSRQFGCVSFLLSFSLDEWENHNESFIKYQLKLHHRVHKSQGNLKKIASFIEFLMGTFL